jgi:hypothetical protein
VDFNKDGIVDLADLVILIEHWDQADPQCDIGPMPWGNGTVDAQDLQVFMEYWGQEISDPGLMAWWKLDETVGPTATDSVGTNGGTLLGNPTWQPAGGKVKGALRLDGGADHILIPFLLSPASGPFSVFLWAKGGMPGQVLLSQATGADWLVADTVGGTLTTELIKNGRPPGSPLMSQTPITDGIWHRVGFVWDGSNRILYVDDVEVARDTHAILAGSAGGLHLGAGSSLAPGTFWSGLIDDVRIYDRAVKP